MVKTSPVEFQKFISSLHLNERQVVLIPIESNGKRPMVSAGESWKDPKYHLTISEAVKRLEEGGNIGVVANDWLVIVDLDNPEKYTFPKTTLTVKTRNGRLHKFYINDGSVVNAVGKNSLAKCGEVRAEWQYVVAAGSYVPADNSEGTGLYTVIDDCPLATLSQSELPEDFIPTNQELPATLPKEVLTSVYCDKNKYGWTLDDIRQRDKKLDDLLDGGLAGLPSQSEADMSIITRLLFWEYNEGEAVSILKKFCYRPKLERQDYIIGILGSITRKEQISNKVNVKTWHPTTGYSFNMIFGDTISEMKKPDTQADKKILAKDINRVAVAEKIMSLYNFVYDQKAKTVYVYNDHEGIYSEDTEDIIAETTRTLLLEHYDTCHLPTISSVIKCDSPKIEMNTTNPELLAVNNGILNVLTQELSEFSPKNYQTNKINVTYDSTIGCPNFLQFLNEVLPDKKQQKQLQQLVGHTLYKKIITETCLVLHGAGQNGKSILLEVLSQFLDHTNISAHSIQDICYDKFTPVELQGKLANICTDLPQKQLVNTGTFKAAVSGDIISGRKKFIQKIISFKSYAKFIFSSNALPCIANEEDSISWYRRFLILDFKTQFNGKTKKPRQQLIQQLTTPQELTGILNWALEGLKQLHHQGEISNKPEIEELKRNYRKHSGTTLNFFDNQIRVTDNIDDYVEADILFLEYLKYCQKHGGTAKNKKLFFEDLARYMPMAYRRRIPDKQTGAWLQIYSYIRVCSCCNDKETLSRTVSACRDCPGLAEIAGIAGFSTLIGGTLESFSNSSCVEKSSCENPAISAKTASSSEKDVSKKEFKPEKPQPTWHYNHIKPAEKCDHAGCDHAYCVEFELMSPCGDEIRCCQGCFERLQRQFSGVNWEPWDDSDSGGSEYFAGGDF